MKPNWLALGSLIVGVALPAHAALHFVSVTNITGLPPATPLPALAALACDGDAVVVAVGPNSTAVRGTQGNNGIDWTLEAGLPAGLGLQSAAFGAGGFVASGADNVILTLASGGGSAWVDQGKALANSIALAGLAFNSHVKRFAAAPKTAGLAWAADPTAPWNVGQLRSPGGGLNAVPFESFRAVTPLGTNGFAACGAYGDVRISTDGGETWIGNFTLANLSQPDLLGIAWDGAATLVCVGRARNADAGIIWVSTDSGASWAPAVPPLAACPTLNAVAYTAHGFMAVGQAGTILTSPDGITWTQHNSGLPAQNYLAVTGPTAGALQGLAVLVGDGGNIVLAGDTPAPPADPQDATTYAGYPATVRVSVPPGIAADWFDTSGTLLASNTSAFVFPPQDNWVGTNELASVLRAQARDLRTALVNTNFTEVTVTVRPRPTARLISVDPATPLCDGALYPIVAMLDGRGPWTVTWWDGAVSNETAKLAIRFVYPSGMPEAPATQFSYWVANLTDCDNNRVGTNEFPALPGDLLGTNHVTLDPVPPTVATKQLPILLLVGTNGVASLDPTQVDDGSSDDCGIAPGGLSLDRTVFTCEDVDLGPLTVTLTVADTHGNTSTGTATVWVVDTLAPVVRTKPCTVPVNAAGQVVLNPADVDDGSWDNCGILGMEFDPKPAFTASDIGSHTVTLKVTDAHGNWATNTATVTVVPGFSIGIVDNKITLTWFGNSTLQSTPALVDPPSNIVWTDVLTGAADTVNTWSPAPGDGSPGFFRLKAP